MRIFARRVSGIVPDNAGVAGTNTTSVRRCGLAVFALCAVFFSALSTNAALPSEGFITYSKGDREQRTLTMRRISNGQLQSEQKICNKGSIGGDIEGVISFDGKWLAFCRPHRRPKPKMETDDYHDFGAYDVYVVRIDGNLPAEPKKVDKGYFPSWGDDSRNPTKTLYYCDYGNKDIKKATIGDDGSVSNVTKHGDVPTNESDLHMMASPDGKKVAYRQNKVVWIYHFSGTHKGKKFDAGRGCHPSWLANSRWLIHATNVVIRDDGQHYEPDLNGTGDYHYGTDPDMKWFITRTTGNYKVQNEGQQVHIMPLTVTDNSFSIEPGKKELVTSDGSWVDVHTGSTGPVEVSIEGFSAEPPSITPGASATLQWTVTAATAVSVDGQPVTGNSMTVSPTATTTYTLTVEGEGGPKTATTTVTVSAPVLTSIAVDPAVATVDVGKTVSFTATTLDQAEAPIAGAVTWSLEGFGALSATTGPTVTYTAPANQAGTVKLVASSGTVTRDVEVTVVDPDAFKLKINCGGDVVEDWESDAGYVVAANAGSPYPFSSSPIIDNVADPAPAAVYQTVRHRNHAYHFPDIAAGTYTVRFHFMDGSSDGSGGRQMNYSVDGQVLLENFNVVEASGGLNKAVVKEFDIELSGTDGLHIVGTEGSGNDVFCSGIEIISAGSTMPPKTIILDNTFAASAFKTGDIVPVKWVASGDVSAIIIAVSLDAGRTWEPIVSEQIGRDDPEWGNFQWTVPATLAGNVVSTTNAKVRVHDYAGDVTRDDSDPFPLNAESGVADGMVQSARTPVRLSMSSSRIAIQGLQPGPLALNILLPNGKIVSSVTTRTAGSWKSELSGLSTSVYYIQIKNGGRVLTRRVTLID
jgi:hypothetical protein